MERRPYFIFGDLLACGAVGAAAAWLVWLAVPGGWFTPVGMAVGMVAGMFVGAVGGILFTPLFGGMEISMPTGLAGMAAGMVGAMLSATPAGAEIVLWVGAAVGWLCLAYTYFLQNKLRGEAE